MNRKVVFCLCLLGAFAAETHEVKQVPVKEGDPVSLPSGVGNINPDDQIIWYYKELRIAHLRENSPLRVVDWMSLEINQTTGDLRILNISLQHSGLYKIQKILTGKESWSDFNITVHGPNSREEEKLQEGTWILAVALVIVLVALGFGAFFCYKKCRRTKQEGPISREEVELPEVRTTSTPLMNGHTTNSTRV